MAWIQELFAKTDNRAGCFGHNTSAKRPVRESSQAVGLDSGLEENRSFVHCIPHHGSSFAR
jgi:hypothetical protein